MRGLITWCLVLVVLMVTPLAALAEDAARTPAEVIAGLEAKIAAEEKAIAGLERKKEPIQAKKDGLEARIAKLKTEIERLENELRGDIWHRHLNDPDAEAKIRRQIEALDLQREELRDEIDELDDDLRDLDRGIETARLNITTFKRQIALQKDRIYAICRDILDDFRTRKDALVAEAQRSGPDFALVAALGYITWSEKRVAAARAAQCGENIYLERILAEQKAGYTALADLIAPACSEPGAGGASTGAESDPVTATDAQRDDACRAYGFDAADGGGDDDPVRDDGPVSDADRQAYLSCVCNCAAPQGGQFSCTYDTEDRGWSPSCATLENGPCICKAYGCFRAALPAGGDCVESCRAAHPAAAAASSEGRGGYTPVPRGAPAVQVPDRLAPGQVAPARTPPGTVAPSPFAPLAPAPFAGGGAVPAAPVPDAGAPQAECLPGQACFQW